MESPVAERGDTFQHELSLRATGVRAILPERFSELESKDVVSLHNEALEICIPPVGSLILYVEIERDAEMSAVD